MTTTTILPPAYHSAASGGFRIDPSRGERSARVSSEWFSRPDDERYLSLSDLHAATLARADRATARTVESRAIRVEASRDNAERVPGRMTRSHPHTGPSARCAAWSPRHRRTCVTGMRDVRAFE